MKSTRPEKTILLVEEQSCLRKLIAEVLTTNGYRVILTEDGEDAARLFSRLHSNISLVLADVHLPKLNGDRLLRLMKRIDPQVPLVFEAGYLDSRLEFSLIRAGAKGFIQKPSTPQEIVAKVKCILRGKEGDYIVNTRYPESRKGLMWSARLGTP